MTGGLCKIHGGLKRDDAQAMQCLIPGWIFDPKKPYLVRPDINP